MAALHLNLPYHKEGHQPHPRSQRSAKNNLCVIYLLRENLCREHALLSRLSARFSCRKQNVLGASKGHPLVEHWSPGNRECARVEHSPLPEPEERLTFILHGIVAYALPWWSAASFQTQMYRPQHSLNFPTSAHNGLRLVWTLLQRCRWLWTSSYMTQCLRAVRAFALCKTRARAAWSHSSRMALVSRRPHQRFCHEGRFPYSSAIEGFCLHVQL